MKFSAVASKFLVIVINTVLILFVTLIIVTNTNRSNENDIEYSAFELLIFDVLPIWLINIFCIFFASFAVTGCIGALTENRPLLTIHWVMLFLMYMLSIVLFALTAIMYVSDIPFIKDEMYRALNKYKVSQKDREFIDLINQKYNCCGVISYNDYQVSTTFIPWSCCNKNKTDIDDTCTIPEVSYKPGCLAMVKNTIGEFLKMQMGVSASAVLILLIALILVSVIREYAENNLLIVSDDASMSDDDQDTAELPAQQNVEQARNDNNDTVSTISAKTSAAT